MINTTSSNRYTVFVPFVCILQNTFTPSYKTLNAVQQQCNIASTLTQFFHVAYRQPVPSPLKIFGRRMRKNRHRSSYPYASLYYNTKVLCSDEIGKKIKNISPLYRTAGRRPSMPSRVQSRSPVILARFSPFDSPTQCQRNAFLPINRAYKCSPKERYAGSN